MRALDTSTARFLLAIFIGVVTVAGNTLIFSLLTGAALNLGDEFAMFAIQMVMVSVPFLLLALLGIRSRGPWLLGLGLTAILWGYYMFDSLSRRGDGSGANIGLGLLLVASPVLISVACVVAARRTRED